MKASLAEVQRLGGELQKLAEEPGLLSPPLTNIIAAEVIASRHKGRAIVYQNGPRCLIPGFLQTDRVMEELFASYVSPEGQPYAQHEIDQFTEVRTLRREVVTNGVGCTAFLGTQLIDPRVPHPEGAPLHPLSDEARHGQLAQFIQYAEETWSGMGIGYVQVYVVPEDANPEALPLENFYVVRTPESDDGPEAMLVTTEDCERDQLITDQAVAADIAGRQLNQLRELALNPRDSLDYMRQIAAAL